MRMIKSQGILIATQVFGVPDDPALILVMGATASMLGWPDAFCTALANRGFYVIRFDHRDTGQSTTVQPGEASYAVEDLAADVIGVMDGYNLDSAHILGMSLGGYISQIVALTHPGRVRSLTLLASEPLGWDGPALPHISQEFLDHFGILASLDWASETATIEFLLTSERLSAGSGQAFDETYMRGRIRQILARTTSPASMFNHAILDTRQDWIGRYRDITVPVLILHGSDDPILPVKNGEALAAGIAGSELIVVDGVGHELPLSKVETIADLIAGGIPQ
ncbi:alpha/beta fold hydrolase [Algicella marina]|nr:alpha/beta hydrolase [Algicella marina]